MPINVTCPSCDKAYTLDDSLRGKKVRCRACEEIIPIPAATPSKKSDGITERKPAAAVPAVRDEHDDEDDDRPRRKASSRRDDDEEDERTVRKNRRNDDEDEDDDSFRRRSKRKQKAASGPPWLLIGGGAAALVAVVVVVIVLVAGGSNDQKIAQAPPVQPQPPGPGQVQPVPQPVQPVQPVAPIKPVDLAAGAMWNVPVGAAPPALAAVNIPLPDKSDPSEAVKAIVVSPISRKAVVGLQTPRKDSRILLCDLATSQVIGKATLPSMMVPMAVTDDGAQVLLRRDDAGGGNQDRLELWALAGQELVKKQDFLPYGDQQGGQRDVRWAAYLSNNRLVTMSAGGRVLGFDAPGGKSLFRLDTDGGGRPALSPDRKMLLYSTGKEICLYDLDALKVLGQQPLPGFVPWPVMEFSPSGKSFACTTIDRFYFFDTATGALRGEIKTGINPFGHFGWTSDKHLLIGGGALFDVELQFRVWDYRGQSFSFPAGGLTYFVVHGGAKRTDAALLAAVLPSPANEQAIQKAAADPTFVVLRPGTTVKVDVSALPDPAEREKAATLLTAQLVKNGCGVGPNGTIDLIASADIGKERELTYYTMPEGSKKKFGPPMFGPKFGKGGSGPPPGAVLKQAQIVEHYARLKFVFQGQQVWERSQLNIPSQVRLEEGETMQEHLRKLEHPPYDLYRIVELPRVLLRAQGAAALGSTEVTLNGLP